ncbi:MAG: hypothetical protein WBW33_28430 [Bryobacteraceae bacterium]
MPEITVAGYWKGLIVTHSNFAKIDVYFEDVEGEPKARFEAPDVIHLPTKGELKVLLVGNRITMVTPGSGETVWFTGEVLGEEKRHMIHGVIHDPKFTLLAGTLTLFAQDGDEGDLAFMYR